MFVMGLGVGDGLEFVGDLVLDEDGLIDDLLGGLLDHRFGDD